MNLIQFTGALELGLLSALVAMGIYLTFRVINFPDLTVDGSYTLGASTVAYLIVNDWNPITATLMATLAGALAGLVTGFLHVSFKILGLLAGILTMTALYSINLRIMDRPNISLHSLPSVFSYGSSSLELLALVVFVAFLILVAFMLTRMGLAMRASGINPKLSPAYGINVGRMTLLGLAISNALVALAGALFAQQLGFADISMGTGTLIVGLASVIVGETLVPSFRIPIIFLGVILGSIVYRLAIAMALNINIKLEFTIPILNIHIKNFSIIASDLQLITAILVVIALLVPQLKKSLNNNKISLKPSEPPVSNLK